jgi:hypothetical protein
MKLSRVLLAVVLLAGLAGVGYVAQKNEAPGLKMADAAQKFLDSLTKEQKDKAALPFESTERVKWHFVPLQDKNKQPTRKGLPLQDMSAEQKKAALALLEAGTSADGDKQAVTIMSLESILRELEKGGAMVRNPEWYFFTVFGSPSKTGKWGWRVEGHHLSLNFTLNGGQVVSSTPAFFGANPATVKGGPRKGLRTLAEADDLPRELFNSLDEEQKKVAYHKERFPEPKAQTADPAVGAPQGLPAAKMNDQQRALLVKLLRAYANRMPPEVAEAELDAIQKAGLDKVHFAFNGATESGKPHTYRIQGPTFVVEFLNEQGDSAGNPANHIHSVWRKPQGDFDVIVRK